MGISGSEFSAQRNREEAKDAVIRFGRSVSMKTAMQNSKGSKTAAG